MPRIPIKKGCRIRALIVDDSVVIRRLVTQALSEDESFEVVGSAANGGIAMQRIAQLSPDVVTLDVEMPEVDGLETLRLIRQKYPTLVVIMFSTLTARGSSATLDALSVGANDYVTKASHAGSLDRSIAALRHELVPKIKQFFDFEESAKPLAAQIQNVPLPQPPRVYQAASKGPRRALVIGVSTGGPTALAEIFPEFPGNIDVPILLVQHMPPMFTRLLAERLQLKSKLRVEEAQEGTLVEPGKAVIAAGDFHLKVKRQGAQVVCTLNQDPPENSCRPAVDVLFRSAQAIYGGSVVAVILTGMGQDGLRGVEELKGAGAHVIAQDEESSVVWGMPGAVVRAGLADSVVSLRCMVPEIMRRLAGA